MDSGTEVRPIVLSGGSGLLGRAVQRALADKGIKTIRLVRGEVTGPDQVIWNPAGFGSIAEPKRLEGCEAAIHLSGASVAGRRWSTDVRNELVESRVGSTAMLARTLAELRDPPKTLVVASATGIYGNRGDELLDETSSPGTGFLAELCRAWEGATIVAEKAGIRVVHARFGVVLAKESGALKKMLPIFRLGLGGKLGSGRQWMSWISLEDAAEALVFLLGKGNLRGPVNLTAPNPVTNAEFTRRLGYQLGRPAKFAVPAFALRLAFGEMAQETLLASQRAMPSKLLTAGYPFRYAAVSDALRAALG